MANLKECEGNEILELHTNGGIVELNKKGEMKMLLVEMYYNKKSIETILAIKDGINLGARVCIDSDKDRAIIVTYGGISYKFKECKSGLYYYDLDENKNKNKMIKSNLIQTVKENREHYTKRDIVKVNEVTDVQRYFWRSTDSVKTYVVENQLRNFALTSDDI